MNHKKKLRVAFAGVGGMGQCAPLRNYAAPPQTSSPRLSWAHAMRRQAENFCAAARGERPPLRDAEALEDLVVARARAAVERRLGA